MLVRDELTGDQHEIRASAVINAAGPWVDAWLPPASGTAPTPSLFAASKAFNLDHQAAAVRRRTGIVLRDRRRLRAQHVLRDLPGTGARSSARATFAATTRTRNGAVTPADVQAFLNELNPVLGRHRLVPSDIRRRVFGPAARARGSCRQRRRAAEDGASHRSWRQGWLAGPVLGRRHQVDDGTRRRRARAFAWRASTSTNETIARLKRKLLTADVPAVQDLIAKDADARRTHRAGSAGHARSRRPCRARRDGVSAVGRDPPPHAAVSQPRARRSAPSACAPTLMAQELELGGRRNRPPDRRHDSRSCRRFACCRNASCVSPFHCGRSLRASYPGRRLAPVPGTSTLHDPP